MRHESGKDWTFAELDRLTSAALGSSAAAFAVACAPVSAVAEPLFGQSESWQLVIITGTTIVAPLIVFVIETTQNRDVRSASQAGRTGGQPEGRAQPVYRSGELDR